MEHDVYVLAAYGVTFGFLLILLVAFAQQHSRSARKLRDLLMPTGSHETKN